MYLSTIYSHLLATNNNRSFFLPQTSNYKHSSFILTFILTFIQNIYVHTPSSLLSSSVLPPSFLYLLLENCITKATLYTSGHRNCCTLYYASYCISMQCRYLACSLPPAHTPVHTGNLLSHLTGNHGQLKCRFNRRSWSFSRRSEVRHTNGLFFGARRAVAYPSVPMIRPNICTQAPMRSKVWQQLNTFRRKLHASPYY